MGLKEDFKINREENTLTSKNNREELNNTLKEIKSDLSIVIKNITEQNQKSIDRLNTTIESKITALIEKTEATLKLNRESLDKSLKDFQNSFDGNVKSFNELQRQKFGELEIRQTKMLESTEKKLEQMRETVDEKLQKTLNERLGQSFETVGKQLQAVQEGLGEMKNLAQDVGGLKKVLSNVKMRGGIGEVQLAMLLDQILAPEQYQANVKTKSNSDDIVEFAVKLPGRDDDNLNIWLPIDAKFPKDVYEQLQSAYDIGDLAQIELAQKNLENTIKKMAKDISEKYIDPPNTTDFGIMFLPFEGIYAEVVRKASLLEDLQRNYKIVVTGPTTLAAILNSLQMGFKTLAIQKRSSEVWQILGAVKKEFESFGGMMQKAQNNIQTGLNQLDDVMGKRTRAIQRKLRSVEALDESDAKHIIPEISDNDLGEDEIEIENPDL
ncbi:MAG: DNA recombination protein RmuC [Bacteroidota bacterium]